MRITKVFKSAIFAKKGGKGKKKLKKDLRWKFLFRGMEYGRFVHNAGDTLHVT